MKKWLKFTFILALPLLVAAAVFDYYQTLPIAGAYETGPVDYPEVNRSNTKARLTQLSTETLLNMKTSGLEVIKWNQVMAKVNSNVISEVVPPSDPFIVKEHYPYDEVFDHETHSLYFYHSHRPKEHGHFHLFYCNPEKLSQYEPLYIKEKKSFSVHLLAISIHPDGTPLGFFTTNQWITPKEWWYSHDVIKELVTEFEVTHAYPSWPTNQWINHMLRLFKPQIDDLLDQRDQKLDEAEGPLEKKLHNKKVDILSQVSISIEMQMNLIEEILNERSINEPVNEVSE